MKNVVTKKYKVTLLDPKTNIKSSTIATEEVGGLTIENAFSPLGFHILKKELIETIEENVPQVNQEDDTSNQDPNNIQRHVIKNNNGVPDTQTPINGVVTNNAYQPQVKERIVKHGDLCLKIIGDRVFCEEFIEQNVTDSSYKIIDIKSGKETTSKVLILHKEWVEIKEEEEEVETIEPPKVPTDGEFEGVPVEKDETHSEDGGDLDEAFDKLLSTKS